MSSPFLTIDDVVSRLDALEQGFLASRDRRAVFVTVYGMMSRAMKARVAAGAFHDTAWVGRYTVAFANLYRTALDAYDLGLPVPRCWTMAFRTTPTALVAQDLLLGINAHVNHDLPLALDAVSIDPDRDSRHADHTAVNAVLQSLTDAVSDRVSQWYAPGLAGVDALSGPLDEEATNFNMVVAREAAWEAAVALANARTPAERDTVVRLLDVRAVVVGKLILAPTASPAALDACRRIEAGGWWRLLSEVRALA